MHTPYRIALFFLIGGATISGRTRATMVDLHGGAIKIEGGQLPRRMGWVRMFEKIGIFGISKLIQIGKILIIFVKGIFTIHETIFRYSKDSHFFLHTLMLFGLLKSLPIQV